MPGNTVLINGVIEYYVGDSKMDELLEYLDKYGSKIDKITKEVKGDAEKVSD